MGTLHGRSAYVAREVALHLKSGGSQLKQDSSDLYELRAHLSTAPTSTRKLEEQPHYKKILPRHLPPRIRAMKEPPKIAQHPAPPAKSLMSKPQPPVVPPGQGSSFLGSLRTWPAHNPNKIAICLGFTSRVKGKNVARQAVLGLKGQSPLFQDLLPSLCKTMSHGYQYSLWIGYDLDDPILSVGGASELVKVELSKLVPGCGIDVHMLKVSSSGSPTWAQNEAVLAAHSAGNDFFYRVNDDSVMVSPGWTEKFIAALASMNPPYVGVVGPDHKGGKTTILTYDFTSRKHVEIFGFHYPRAFPTWWGDDWITLVYMPDHMKKLRDVSLIHRVEDIRYVVGEDKAALGTLQREVDINKEKLQRWIKAHPKG